MRTIAALLAVACSGCTLFWIFNSDPEGLPCDFSSDPEGRCLQKFNGVDYTCVEGLCLKARVLQAGDACRSSAQCDERLICATAYAQCGDTASDDVNCQLVGEEAEELACRPVCDLTNPQQCPTGERCFEVQGVPGVNGFCQQATCATDSDCGAVPGSPGLCVNEFGGGRTGLCFELCDPFTCDEQTGRCGSCNGLDGTPDEGFSCFPPPDEFLQGLNDRRLICLPHGGLPPFAPCGEVNADVCGFNTFCVNTGSDIYCAPYCRFPSGAPACDRGTCTQMSPGSTVGYCAL